MNNKYTPGPWKVNKPRKDIRTMFGGDTGIEILAELKNKDGSIGGYHIVVGHKNCQHDYRILDEANARLISAAPELLEALQNLLSDVEYAQPQIKSGLIGNLQIKKALRAIEKATT